MTALNAARRAADLASLPDEVDVLVVGLGVTGAGVALDAASRGLTVLAVEAHDFAFGTSRWSSKLVHGGLRYLAKGQVGIAHESAVERGILMTRTAPHLVRPIATFIPLGPRMSRAQAAVTRAGFWAGDALRAVARTPRAVLPRPRKIGAAEAAELCPSVDPRDLRGALIAYDGQLEDDARLVTALVRTAAREGATILNHTRALDVTGTSATLRDEMTGTTYSVRAKAVVNAAGVWTGHVVPGLKLKPSRGTHLVLRGDSIPGLTVALTAPVPGETNRFVFALPQPDGQIYVGLTDEEVEDEIPDVPQGSEAEITFLLDVINGVLAKPLTRDDIVGTFAGLRPLLDAGGRTADLSRKHAVLTSETGVLTIVGGKLTTYRKMAQDAVDAAVEHASLAAGPCRTHDLPLIGAGPVPSGAPARLIRRYGSEAPEVLANAVAVTGQTEAEVLAPVVGEDGPTLAELIWGVTHEGALTVDDLLDRRTRIGLVAVDRQAGVAAAETALAVATAGH
ncbi:glycerol-3-phosphate dehydrogenase/oxidase [Aeromicrobium sp.]|uniref:glycerol-3-phosphate dehydrogenase/oxidase n=1 Tax=Aeromicrobium sp. TaxID=1871063 RepID=UPI0028AF46A9|nr:glycerol-3-phosphate dehydrogenase/oxidase [Aeromicrobium sp.]